MLIKVCGLNPVRDVQLCLDLKVNFLGFVFYKKSPRNIELSDLDRLNDYNKKNSFFVAVTVDPTNEFITKIMNKNLDYIQLHGSEDNKRLKEIKEKTQLKIIKAIKVNNKKDIELYKDFSEADYILFDTPGMENSIEFPKDLIKELPKGERFALAGGVSVDTIENLTKLGIKFFDLSSSVESKNGYKDHKRIKEFVVKANEQN
tara:strand:- start:199 stop:807 length:609 start_codon:yes stop_codon:yes gene_type:complete